MMDEKTYNKMVAANLRRIMYERGVTQTDMEKDISDLTKYDSDMTQKKPVNKGFFENFLYLRASFISAGSGGRTRIRAFVYRVGLESCQIPCQKSGSGTSLTTKKSLTGLYSRKAHIVKNVC